MSIQTNLSKATFTIAISTSLSDAVEVRGSIVRIDMPAAWTTANLTFQLGETAAGVQNLYDAAGTEVTVTAAAARAIQVNPAAYHGWGVMKVRSGTAAVPVNQAAARTVTVWYRKFE